MRRPADQAKLLCLYLLRSSAAALANQPSVSSASRGAAVASFSSGGYVQPEATATAIAPPLQGHIALRIARRSDVPSIQRCNLATLPENYNPNFYLNHMRQWPELALIAEHVPPGCMADHQRTYSSPQRRKMGSILGAGYDPSQDIINRCEVVGYVLGKVEPRVIPLQERQRRTAVARPSRVTRDDDEDMETLMRYLESGDSTRNDKSSEYLGHVTSLAILDKFRRRGLAAMLMEQLHLHMTHFYEADAVGLHVRISNTAATKLYCNGMGYRVDDVISGYYQDSEDAYFMRKDFTSQLESHIDEEDYEDDDPKLMGLTSSVTGRVKKSLDTLSRLYTGRPSKQTQWDQDDVFALPKYVPLSRQPEQKQQTGTPIGQQAQSQTAASSTMEQPPPLVMESREEQPSRQKQQIQQEGGQEEQQQVMTGSM